MMMVTGRAGVTPTTGSGLAPEGSRIQFKVWLRGVTRQFCLITPLIKPKNQEAIMHSSIDLQELEDESREEFEEEIQEAIAEPINETINEEERGDLRREVLEEF